MVRNTTVASLARRPSVRNIGDGEAFICRALSLGAQARPADPPGARLVRALVDAPFYSRSEIETHLLGQKASAVHEHLSLDRFVHPSMYAMLPFRVPRA